MDIFSALYIFFACALLAIFLAILALILKIYSGKSIGNPSYPPVDGTVFHQLFYFSTLYDHQTEVAWKHPTFRLLAPDQSEFYSTDVRNIEHILKTKLDKYVKGEYMMDIIRDLFGEGIFAVDGDKWRQQRKLASHEFSTRVLRDFSCASFRRSAAKLARVVSEISEAKQIFNIHVSVCQYSP